MRTAVVSGALAVVAIGLLLAWSSRRSEDRHTAVEATPPAASPRDRAPAGGVDPRPAEDAAAMPAPGDSLHPLRPQEARRDFARALELLGEATTEHEVATAFHLGNGALEREWDELDRDDLEALAAYETREAQLRTALQAANARIKRP